MERLTTPAGITVSYDVTGALAAALPNASIGVLEGQAHEGMTTAPDMYLEAVRTFLLESVPILERG